MKTITTFRIALLLGLLLPLFSTSCSRQETAPPQTRASVPNVLRLYSWSDYFDTEILAAFEEKTGIKVDYVHFADFDEMQANLRSRAGHYDVIVTDDSAIQMLWELRLIREFDRSLLPNLSNIAPEYLGLAYDPENRYSAPYMWGTTLVAFRSDLIDEPDPSWGLLWDPDLKGKVMMMPDRLETLSIALMSLGYSLNSEEDKEIQQAAGKCLEQIKQVDVLYGDDAAVREGLQEGTLAAAMCYSGDAAQVAADNENVSFYIPREGAPLWIDSFVIARDTKHPAEAHQLVNYMLEAEVAAANSNYTYYASPNEAALPFIDKELRADPTINPPDDVRKRCIIFEKPSERREELANRAWLRVQKAIQQRDISQRNHDDTTSSDKSATQAAAGL